MTADLVSVNGAVDRQRFAELEAIVQRGLSTFVDVGNALFEIRDSKLYLRTHSTFEDYCRERWQMVASRARQLIGAAQIAANLQSVTTVTPTHESQIRPLAKLEPEQQKEAWQMATATNPEPIASQVEKAVKALNGHRRAQPRVSPVRSEEEERDRLHRQVSTRLFADAVSLFDPRIMTVDALAAHLLRSIDPKETSEDLSRARLERALDVFKTIIANWGTSNV